MKRPIVVASLLAVLFAGCSSVPTKEIERAKTEGVPVIINHLSSSIPNSAGGVNVYSNYFNTSDKTLKYVVLTVLPYNKVGDLAPSEIGRKTYTRIKDIGPIEPNGKGGGGWKNVWYNHSISCVKLTELEVTYMSGESESFRGAQLLKVLKSGISNSCEVL